jgi:glutamine synthetase
MMPMLLPNVNSYKRIGPNLYTPTASTWGIDNRTCAYRVIPGDESALHIELRTPGADCNPYLALAAHLAAGHCGIIEKIEPTEETVGNAWDQEQPASLRFPLDLASASDRFARSEFARARFGDRFVDRFVMLREWQVEQFALAVTDWEIRNFLEGA